MKYYVSFRTITFTGEITLLLWLHLKIAPFDAALLSMAPLSNSLVFIDSLTREIFFNTRTEISHLQMALYYPSFKITRNAITNNSVQLMHSGGYKTVTLCI